MSARLWLPSIICVKKGFLNTPTKGWSFGVLLGPMICRTKRLVVQSDLPPMASHLGQAPTVKRKHAVYFGDSNKTTSMVEHFFGSQNWILGHMHQFPVLPGWTVKTPILSGRFIT